MPAEEDTSETCLWRKWKTSSMTINSGSNTGVASMEGLFMNSSAAPEGKLTVIAEVKRTGCWLITGWAEENES